jgi:hypothetical protein
MLALVKFMNYPIDSFSQLSIFATGMPLRVDGKRVEIAHIIHESRNEGQNIEPESQDFRMSERVVGGEVVLARSALD